jgi:hypothetical protein
MTKFFAEHVPTVVVGPEQANLFNMDSQKFRYMQHAVVSDTLESAMDFAYKVTGTNQVIIFDGAPDGLNASASLAEHLEKAAPEVNERVENELLPKWMSQRRIDPKILQQLPRVPKGKEFLWIRIE